MIEKRSIAGETLEANKQIGYSEVKPVSNALRILSYLTRKKDGVTLTEFAVQLEINVSTCLAILRTLVANGMVEFNPRTKIYVIADGLVSLSSSVLAAAGIEDRFRHAMEDLADEFGVTVSLWRAESPERIRLAISVVSSRNMNIQMRVGQRLPRWIAAVGRVMAAYSDLDEAQLNLRFQELRWRGAMTFERYMNQVSEAKDKGYAIDDGEFAPGIYSLCVPVWSGRSELTMGLSATMFVNQLEAERRTKLIKKLMRLGGERKPQ